jgi:uncharacterized protein YjbJ (UPF0337 family)
LDKSTSDLQRTPVLPQNKKKIVTISFCIINTQSLFQISPIFRIISMSGLPITNSQDTPISVPSQIKSNQSDTPDLSNPYSYPRNPSTKTGEDSVANINVPLNEGPTSFTEMETATDPELSKLKSSFWIRAGQLQSAIGSITGLESWQRSGHKIEEEADREYREAKSRLSRGTPSRIHGEYDRLMGYVNYVVGHVAGDTEMQAEASERLEHGEAEIDKSSRP